MTLSLRYAFLGIFILGFWGLVIGYTQLYVNVTYSISHYFFIGLRNKDFSLKRGDYVAFTHPTYPNQILIKRIEGIPGDFIQNQKKTVLINGTSLSTHLKVPQQASFIPENSYFVAGTHDRSYDSRYDSFGLIHIHQIQGVVWPLF